MILGSINAKGLRSGRKVLAIKDLIREEKLDILFIQETHVENIKVVLSP